MFPYCMGDKEYRRTLCVSICRAIAPIICGALYSMSLSDSAMAIGFPLDYHLVLILLSATFLDGGLSANQYQQAEAVRLILPLKTLQHRSAAAPCINQQPQTVTLLKQGLIPPNLSSTKQQQILFLLNHITTSPTNHQYTTFIFTPLLTTTTTLLFCSF